MDDKAPTIQHALALALRLNGTLYRGGHRQAAGTSIAYACQKDPAITARLRELLTPERS